MNKLLDEIGLRFVSGNSVPVERATLTRAEYDQLRALLSAQEPTETKLFAVHSFVKEYGSTVCISEYCGSMNDIRERVMEKARREGFKGDFVERMAELGWWLVPLYTVGELAKQDAK